MLESEHMDASWDWNGFENVCTDELIDEEEQELTREENETHPEVVSTSIPKDHEVDLRESSEEQVPQTRYSYFWRIKQSC